MKLRQVAALAAVAVACGACKKKPPPVAPPPAEAPVDSSAIRAQARADSIAAAQRAAREQEARERAAAVRRVQDALSNVVYFEYDSFELTAEAQNNLRTKAAIMRVNPNLQIRIEGNADERGSTEYNLALGQRRAEAVKDFLGGYGIADSRITTISYGEERPAVQGHDEAAWRQNRRAEVVITGGEITTVPPEVG